MRKIHMSVLIGVSLTAPAAWGAGCSDATKLTGAELVATVLGRTVCYQGANPAEDWWQEEHRATGELWDYKGGPNHPTDPQKQVGRWEFDVDSAGVKQGVIYRYKDGSSYTFTIHKDGESYTFCNGDNAVVTGAWFQDSPNCGFPPPPESNP